MSRCPLAYSPAPWRGFSRRAGFLLVLAGVVASAFPPAMASTVYQWKDANGVTHFSDSPPPDRTGYTNRTLRDAEPTAAPVPVNKPTEDPACATARRNLEHLRSDRPVGLDANGDGKLDQEMDAQERARQTQLAEQTLQARCQPATSGT